MLDLRPNTTQGQGHISRCEVLAHVWGNNQGDWVVVDDYDATLEHHKTIRAAGHKLLVIDDNAHLSRYDCDVLVNPNAHGQSLKYKTSKDTRLLLGPKYALIRQEFQRWKRWRDDDPERARRVLVALGSAATEELKAKVKSALGEIECEARWANEASHIPSFMAWADVGILSASLVSLEACFMGLPSVLVTTADNQFGNATALDAEGCGYLLGMADRVTKIEVTGAVTWLLWDIRGWCEMRERQMHLVDGDGAKRVVEAMLER